MIIARRKNPKSAKGFTLIEVIVALGIIATAMAAVMMTVSANVRNATGLKERTIAHWVAMNKMTELIILNEREWPPLKTTNGSVLMAKHEWFWEQEVEKTEIDTIRRVHVRVRINEEDEFPTMSLVGFVGKPS